MNTPNYKRIINIGYFLVIILMVIGVSLFSYDQILHPILRWLGFIGFFGWIPLLLLIGFVDSFLSKTVTWKWIIGAVSLYLLYLLSGF